MNIKLILSLPLTLAALMIAGCGKTMTGTPVQRGGNMAKVTKALNTSLIPLSDITEPKAKCFSLARLSSKFREQGSAIADNLVLINTTDLQLGTGKFKLFAALPDTPANEALRANLLLQPGKWNIGPIYKNITVSEIASSNDPEIQKIGNLLMASNQTACSSVNLGESAKPATIRSSSATTLSIEESPGGTGRDYEMRVGGLMITTYTDFDVLTGQKTPNLCGNTQPLVVKQSYYIHFGMAVKDLTISSSFLQLMKSHLNTPTELIGAKVTKAQNKSLKSTVQFAKESKLTQIPVNPIVFENVVNAINTPGHVINLNCP